MKYYSIFALLLLALATGCASTGPGADLNQSATIEELEARIATLEKKVNRALKQSATAKIDASTALAISTSLTTTE